MNYCFTCGAQRPNGASFCPQCGTPFFAPPDRVPAPGAVLLWGILGSLFSLTILPCVLGLIFSLIARKKGRTYVRSGAPYSKRVDMGMELARVGFNMSIMFVCLLGIAISLIAVGAIYVFTNR